METNLGKSRVTRLAAALSGFGLTAVSAWALSSGLTKPPTELFSRTEQLTLSFPYRGVCQNLSLMKDGRELPLLSCDVRAGLARASILLPVGRHDIEVHFDTLLPGLQRSYPVSVVIDSTPPPLVFKESGPLFSSPPGATVEKRVLLEGEVEPSARLFLGSGQIPLTDTGSFQTEIELEPGWNHLLLRAEDRAGNSTSRKLMVFYDTKDPEIVWKVAPGQAFGDSKARLEFSIRDDGPLAGVTGTVDGKPMEWHRKSEDNWLGITERLPEGRHDVELKVADLAGRVTTSRRDILIDSSETLGEKVLGLGARGADVLQLHKRLKEAGYVVDELSSVFNAVTRQALESLQKEEGLEVTGMADFPTLAILGPRILINLKEFSLVLERPGQPDRRWTIASGTSEHPTPTGRFVVYEKVVDPTWLPPDSEWAKDAKPVEPGPDNPLGTRWIGLDWGGIGIHGTNAPWTVGSAASHGCMRMETYQVEELFELVEVGTPVIILGGWEDDPLVRKFWP